MASLKKQPKSNLAVSKKTALLSHLKSFLGGFFLEQKRINPRLLIAYSGGLDSTVLLHSLYQLQKELPMQLQAVHINHGLNAQADQWAQRCQDTCSRLNIPLSVLQVHVDQESGLGIEATARAARYQALASADADYICLGHHQDDQAETLLLQLARGAGVKGLSGMAALDLGRRLVRPLLNTPRVELNAYAKQHQLEWIEDDSNSNTMFDRNFIRHILMPVFLF